MSYNIIIQKNDIINYFEDIKLILILFLHYNSNNNLMFRTNNLKLNQFL